MRYQDNYYPAFWWAKVRTKLQKVIDLLERWRKQLSSMRCRKHWTGGLASASLRRLARTMTELARSKETIGTGNVAATVTYILEWLASIDTRRERVAPAGAGLVSPVKKNGPFDECGSLFSRLLTCG